MGLNTAFVVCVEYSYKTVGITELGDLSPPCTFFLKQKSFENDLIQIHGFKIARPTFDLSHFTAGYPPAWHLDSQ